jgi:hypothetical protein
MWIGAKAPIHDTILVGGHKVPVGSLILFREDALMIGRAYRNRYKVPYTDPPRYYSVDQVLTNHGRYGVLENLGYIGTFKGQGLVTQANIYSTLLDREENAEYQALLTRAVSCCSTGDEGWAKILGECADCHLRKRCISRRIYTLEEIMDGQNRVPADRKTWWRGILDTWWSIGVPVEMIIMVISVVLLITQGTVPFIGVGIGGTVGNIFGITLLHLTRRGEML